MAGGKRKTALSKQKSGEKSSDPPGKHLNQLKKKLGSSVEQLCVTFIEFLTNILKN